MTTDTVFYLVAPGQGAAQPTDDCLIGRSPPVTALPRYQPVDGFGLDQVQHLLCAIDQVHVIVRGNSGNRDTELIRSVQVIHDMSFRSDTTSTLAPADRKSAVAVRIPQRGGLACQRLMSAISRSRSLTIACPRLNPRAWMSLTA
jgi:hypothetical protein